MPDAERLFIGGPLDGQRRLVPGHQFFYVVVDRPMPGAGMEAFLYRLELVIDPAREPLCVFALYGTGRVELADRLRDLETPAPALPLPPGLQDVTLSPEAAGAIRALLDGLTPGATGREVPTLPDAPSFAPRGAGDA